jgi:hypothetical protein
VAADAGDASEVTAAAIPITESTRHTRRSGGGLSAGFSAHAKTQQDLLQGNKRNGRSLEDSG